MSPGHVCTVERLEEPQKQLSTRNSCRALRAPGPLSPWVSSPPHPASECLHPSCRPSRSAHTPHWPTGLPASHLSFLQAPVQTKVQHQTCCTCYAPCCQGIKIQPVTPATNPQLHKTGGDHSVFQPSHAPCSLFMSLVCSYLVTNLAHAGSLFLKRSTSSTLPFKTLLIAQNPSQMPLPLCHCL